MWELQSPDLLPCIETTISSFSPFLLAVAVGLAEDIPNECSTSLDNPEPARFQRTGTKHAVYVCLCDHVTCRSY